MKYSNIIITGGISLFSSNNIFGKLTKEKTCKYFEFDRTNPFIKNADDDVIIKKIKIWTVDMMTHYKNKKINHEIDESEISAEFSMLAALKKNNLLSENFHLSLFYTEQINGKIGGEAAAILLKRIIEDYFSANVELIGISSFSVSDKKSLRMGISYFMTDLFKVLQGKDKYSTFFAPIGGYKVITAFGYIAGSVANFPTGYLHEDTQALQIIPPVPINIDENFIKDYKDHLRIFFLSDNEVVDINTLPVDIKHKFTTEFSFLFEIIDNMISLNPFGDFILRNRFPEYFNWKIMICADIESLYNKNQSIILDGIYGLLKRISSKETEILNRNLVHHEANWGSHSFLYSIYKPIARSKGPIFRCAWKVDRSKMILFIKDIWLNHDSYTSANKNLNILNKEPKSFTDISRDFYDKN